MSLVHTALPRIFCRDRWLGLEEQPLVAERDGATLEGDARQLPGEDRLLPTWQKATLCISRLQVGWRPVYQSRNGGRPRLSLFRGSWDKYTLESGQSYQVLSQPQPLTLISRSLA